jgi:O-methyltransferase involved in polyketide biosynthesis
MYLSNPAVEHLLGDLAARAPGGSRLALSAREVAPGAPPIAKARDAAGRLILAWIGEPRRSAFGFGETTVLLERTGWKVVRVIEQASLRGPQPRRKGLLLAAEPS